MLISSILLLLTLSESKLVCQPKKDLGVYCATDAWCKSGHCANEKCEPKLPTLGKPCLDFGCAEGLGCDLERNSTCQELPTIGQECAMSPLGPYLCRKGLGCYNGICSQLKTKINSTCTDLFNDCAPGLGCSFLETGQSVCVPLRSLNQKCTAYDCKPGLYCDIKTNTCALPLNVKGDCSLSGVCKDGLDCKPITVTQKFAKFECTKPSSVMGTACTTICGDGYFCGPF